MLSRTAVKPASVCMPRCCCCCRCFCCCCRRCCCCCCCCCCCADNSCLPSGCCCFPDCTMLLRLLHVLLAGWSWCDGCSWPCCNSSYTPLERCPPAGTCTTPIHKYKQA